MTPNDHFVTEPRLLWQPKINLSKPVLKSGKRPFQNKGGFAYIGSKPLSNRSKRWDFGDFGQFCLPACRLKLQQKTPKITQKSHKNFDQKWGYPKKGQKWQIRAFKGSFKMTQNYQTATHNAWGTPQKWVRSDLPGIDRFLGVPQLAPFQKLLQDAELDPKGSKNLQKPLKFGQFWPFLRFWGQIWPIFSRFCCWKWWNLKLLI